MNKTIIAALAGIAGLGMAAAPAMAHHSFASYDMLKVESVQGTLKEFRWGAPHSSLVLTYRDKGGRDTEMTIVSGSPLSFSKQGFTPRDFKRGDKVTVTYHPNINGAVGGALASITIPGGRTYSDTEAAKAPK